MNRRNANLMLALAFAAALSGCASIKRATGQLDDTVLPGQRENVLPPEQQQARDPSVTGKSTASGTGDGSLSGDDGVADDSLQGEQAECLPDEPNCISQKPVKPKKGSSTAQ